MFVVGYYNSYTVINIGGRPTLDVSKRPGVGLPPIFITVYEL